MGELPAGTVSLLFSDIEGSTRLARELEGLWVDSLLQHRDLCRQAWAAQGGHEVGTEGDSFFVVFTDPTAAVEAAVAAQLLLGGASWPARALTVRIGIHTGTPLRADGGYVGLDVHKAARVSSAAHGGQVLISGATADLLTAQTPAGIRLRDLGMHHLKDLPEQMRLVQVTADGLTDNFPAVRSRGAAVALPAMLTPTHGRDAEVAELAEALVRGDRLLTLTGPGGTGKTRLGVSLAARVAGHYADGVYFVSLETASTRTDMWPVIAEVLAIPAEGHAPPAFFDHLGNRQALLVLDNLEQIPDADQVVGELLQHAGSISVVATSRRPLHLTGERVHPVPPLDLPSVDSVTADEATGSSAVRLFADHAARVRRGFVVDDANAAAVCHICRVVEGMPLAIELAAARVRMFTPQVLLQRLGDVQRLSSQDRTRRERQRSIRGAIQWSYDLLSSQEQDVLQHLSVFDGGATFDAMAAVAPPEAQDSLEDVLFSLVDASLANLGEDDEGGLRFSMLDSIRTFAREQLQSDPVRWSAAVRRHGQFFYDLAAQLREISDTDVSRGRRTFLAEIENLRALAERRPHGVLHVGCYGGTSVPPAHVAALCCSVAAAYFRQHEARAWVEELLASDLCALPSDRVVALAVHSAVAFGQADFRGCIADAAAVLDLLEVVPPYAHPVPLWVDPDRLRLRSLRVTAVSMSNLGETDGLSQTVEEIIALGRALGGQAHLQALITAYILASEAGEFDRTLQLMTDARQVIDELDLDSARLLWETDAAGLDLRRGRKGEAQERMRSVADEAVRSGDPFAILLVAAGLTAAVADVEPTWAARALASINAFRVTEGVPRRTWDEEDEAGILAAARPRISAQGWEAAWAEGSGRHLPDVLRDLARLPPRDEPAS